MEEVPYAVAVTGATRTACRSSSTGCGSHEALGWRSGHGRALRHDIGEGGAGGLSDTTSILSPWTAATRFTSQNPGRCGCSTQRTCPGFARPYGVVINPCPSTIEVPSNDRRPRTAAGAAVFRGHRMIVGSKQINEGEDHARRLFRIRPSPTPTATCTGWCTTRRRPRSRRCRW